MSARSGWIARIVRNDRGDNSLMTVLAQNIAIVLLVPMMAAMLFLLQGSMQVTDDAQLQTDIKIASDQFAADFNHAGKILPLEDGTSVAAISDRYDLKGQRIPGSAALPSDTDRQCRISVWAVDTSHTPASVRNTILWGNNLSIEGMDASTCYTVSATSIINAVRDTLANPESHDNAQITYPVGKGVVASASLKFYNLAHNDIIASESGLAYGKVADPTGWYTTVEWQSLAVAEVRMTGSVTLNSSDGDDTFVFWGRTNQIDKALQTCDPSDPDTATDPSCDGPGNPDTEHWVPDPPTNITVERCTGGTIGADPAGIGLLGRECAEVNFTPPPVTQCGPFTMRFRVTLVNNRGVAHQVVPPVTGDSSPVRVPNAWNGNQYTVFVSAFCDGAGDPDGDPGQATFTQSMPPSRVDVAFGGTESTQTVSWSPPTSDTTVQYEVRTQEFDFATPVAKWTEIGDSPRTYFMPSPVTSGNWNKVTSWSSPESATYAGKTVRPGYPVYYSVNARVPSPSAGQYIGNKVPNIGYASIVYSLTPNHAPTVSVTDNSSTSVTVSIDNASGSCPANTSAYFAFQTNSGRNSAGLSGMVGEWHSSDWGTATSISQSRKAGQLIVGRAVVGCQTDYATLPDIGAMLGTAAYVQNTTNAPEDSATSGDTGRINDAHRPMHQFNSQENMNLVRVSTWEGHYRPATTQGAPTGLGRSVSGQVSTGTWSGAACSVGTAEYHPILTQVNLNTSYNTATRGWNIFANDPNVSHPEPGGSRYVYRVDQRCRINLPSYDLPDASHSTSGAVIQPLYYSPQSSSGGYQFYTQVNGPSTPGISGPGSVYEGNSYSIGTSAGGCSAGNGWTYTSNPAGGYVAPRDWNWPTAPAARTYTVSGKCYMPSSSNGGSTIYSGSASNSTTVTFMNVDPRPVPSTPSGLKALDGGSASVVCDYSTGWSRIGWSASSNTDYYKVTVQWPDSDGATRSASTTTTDTQYGYTASGGIWASFSMTYYVQAVGPGGSSGTGSLSVSRSPGCVPA